MEQPLPRTAPWPAGTGEMADRIRAHDWASTPLGPVETWPQSLRTTIDLLLPSGFPTVALWGAQLVQIYNDRYRDLMGIKHPGGLGQPTRECWPEVWTINEPIYHRVWAGETLTFEDGLYPLSRSGRVEDVWLTLTYSPIRDETGTIAGVLVTVIETTDRVLAERALRESEQRYRRLVEDLAQAVWEADANGVVVEDSPTWRAYTGQTREEWLGYGWLDAIHPDDRDYAERQWRESVAARREVNAQFRIRRSAGGWQWTNVRAVPLLGPDGQVRKWVGMNIDIGARKEAEAALRESEERFRQFGEASTDILWIRNADSLQWEYLSPAYEAVYGESLGEARKSDTLKHWAERILPEDRAHVLDHMRKVIAGERVTFEYRIRRPGGQVRWMRNTDFPLRDENGRVQRVGGIGQDITDQKRAEETLSQSEERFRLIVENAHDYAILITDPQNRITDWFPGAETVFGWSAEEILGRPGDLLFTPEDREAGEPEKEVETARANDIAPDRRWHLRKDGRKVFIEGSVTALRRQDGSLQSFLKIGQDVTPHRAYEDTLRTSERHAKFLLAELQHRVRNTLGVIRSIARRTAMTSETAEDYAMHLEGRIDAFARVQAAVTRDPEAGLDLEMLVADELRAVAAHEGDQVKSISGPRTRLQPKAAETLALAIHELATNAVKYGALSAPQGGIEVAWSIDASGDRPHLVFRWIETGVSLDPDEPRRRGFGAELIERTLNYELGSEATLDFTPSGLHCTIVLPLDTHLFLLDRAKRRLEH